MSVDSFWPNFCKGIDISYGNDFGIDPLAVAVLKELGIAHTGIAGGPLKGLDIKHMDAEQVIKLSLLDDAFSKGIIREMIVNEEGIIEFKEIGAGDGLSGCTIYHQIQSSSYIEKCTGVMVTGKKQLPKRKAAEFKPIWGNGPKEIYNCFWMSENGLSKKFSQYAIIVFKDPHLVTGKVYEDGIDSLYEVLSPWEQIIGYARYIDWPNSNNSPKTTVERANTSTIPILVSGEQNSVKYNANLGTLQPKENKQPIVGVGGLTDQSYAPSSQGVKIPIPETFRYSTVRESNLDMFIDVSAVYVVGRRISSVIGIPVSDADAILEDGKAKIMINITSQSDSVYRLKEGDHYVITYDEGNVGIVFADNSRVFDPATFGSDVNAEVDITSTMAAGETLLNVSILPTGGTEGYLVKQIIALVNLQTPCIKVYDPRPGEALKIANELEYSLAALVFVEEPAPVAFNGSLIDMSDMEVDHDPTTVQDFSETDYEKAIDKMSSGGGGLAVTLSFLDKEECVSASNVLKNHLDAGNGTVTTYVCGPDSTPQLGGHGADSVSIVNDIVYSYSDSNSYTISVSTGPKLLGDLANITSGATMKTTENVPSTGIVIEDMGNHVHFKVMLDGCGTSPIVAINTAPKVIRVGDRVQCTVHNNPVEQ